MQEWVWHMVLNFDYDLAELDTRVSAMDILWTISDCVETFSY